MWVLIHIEVQSQAKADFAKRMFVYCRIYDQYEHQIVGLAVLADTRVRWRPTMYRNEFLGCEIRYRYPVAKLADFREQRTTLEASDNPFATMVLAHLAAQETQGDPEKRERVKLGLIRRLYERGYNRERVLSLLWFIDWLLALRRSWKCRCGRRSSHRRQPEVIAPRWR
jgi:hypothetical protein